MSTSCPYAAHKAFLCYLLTVGLLLFSVGCNDSASPTQTASPEKSKPKALAVVATTGMIADVVKEIVGDKGTVTTLIGAGVDPHLFKATRDDIAKMTSADVVFYNGLLLEGKMTDALIRVAGSGKVVVPVCERLPEAALIEPDGFSGHQDPHVWMDPTLWSQIIPVIVETLSLEQPTSARYFATNGATYLKTLSALHKYSSQILSSIPQDRRVLVTAHDAFNYFGKQYGLEVEGVQGLSTDSEAGVRDIERMVDILVQRSIGAVFIETTVPSKNVQALIEGAANKGHEVSIGGELFSDAMGKAGTYHGTYVGMIDHNASTIARALGGTIPEGGFQRQLATAP